jgi:hypothetical protein
MKTSKFDRFAKGAETFSRRSSLLTLGAAALTAAGLSPSTADAAKGKKKSRKLCKRQVEPCREGVIVKCAEAAFPEQCEALLLPCCDFLGRCKGREAALCFVVLN